MKRIVFTLIFAVWGIISVGYAQGVREYFYPFDEEVSEYSLIGKDRTPASEQVYYFTKDQYSYYLRHTSFDAGIVRAGTQLSSTLEQLSIDNDKIISNKRIDNNIITGKTESLDKRTLLILPEAGKTAKWTSSGESCSAILITLTVDINNKRQDINAIKVVIKDSATSWGRTEYWAKNMGRILQVYDDGSVGMRSTQLSSLYYKENPYYDVDAAKQEAERARQIEEAQRKEQLINHFLQEREIKTYDLKALDNTLYKAHEAKIHSIVEEIIKRHNPANVNVSIYDKVLISYGGQTSHDILITGLGAHQTPILNEIKNSLGNLQIPPLQVVVPGTNDKFSVSSVGEFTIEYYISTENEDLILRKKSGGTTLLQGDQNFYDMEKQYIDSKLIGKGKYEVDVIKTNICGDISKEVTINDFRKPIDNIMIGYNYSKAAPLGLMVGLNGINCTKHWGVYVGFRTSIHGKVDKTDFDYTSSHPKNEGYSRFGITAGALFAVTKYGYIYGGIGYGKCAVLYSNDGLASAWSSASSNAVYYEATPIKGLEAELGIIIRPIKLIGVSVGYSIIPNFNDNLSKYYGEINFGISIFL